MTASSSVISAPWMMYAEKRYFQKTFPLNCRVRSVLSGVECEAAPPQNGGGRPVRTPSPRDSMDAYFLSAPLWTPHFFKIL